MKITILDNAYKSEKAEMVELEDGLVAVSVSEQEAIRLIKSLASQLSGRSSNMSRDETYCEDGTQFTIIVEFKE